MARRTNTIIISLIDECGDGRTQRGVTMVADEEEEEDVARYVGLEGGDSRMRDGGGARRRMLDEGHTSDGQGSGVARWWAEATAWRGRRRNLSAFSHCCLLATSASI